MAAPKKMSSIWPEMPFMRGPKGAERLREWRTEQSRIHQQTLARRERVLAYPWAQKRLCRDLGYSRAEQWNGYVPPYYDSDGKVNDSPRRAALIKLLHDVADADQEIARRQIGASETWEAT